MEETDKEFVEEVVYDIMDKSFLSVYGIKPKGETNDTIVVIFCVKSGNCR